MYVDKPIHIKAHKIHISINSPKKWHFCSFLLSSYSQVNSFEKIYYNINSTSRKKQGQKKFVFIVKSLENFKYSKAFLDAIRTPNSIQYIYIICTLNGCTLE